MLSLDELRETLTSRLGLLSSGQWEKVCRQSSSETSAKVMKRLQRQKCRCSNVTLPRLSSYQAELIESGEIDRLLLNGNEFLLVDRLGTGGYGSVYRARRRTAGRKDQLVALKFPDFSSGQDPRRFDRECAILCDTELSGADGREHVVHGHCVIQDSGRQVLCMEYIHGVSLKKLGQILRERGSVLELRKVVSLVRSAARGVAFLHDHGIIHRDLKPANLIHCPTERDRYRVRIIDLGIARQTSVSITGSQGPGSFRFSAPECFVNASAVDAAADVFSLAGVCYYLLTGRAPNSELYLTKPADGSVNRRFIHDLERWSRHDSGWEAATAEQFRPELPRRFCAFIRRCLDRQADARPATVHEFAAELDFWSAELEQCRRYFCTTLPRLMKTLRSKFESAATDIGFRTYTPTETAQQLSDDLAILGTDITGQWNRTPVTDECLRHRAGVMLSQLSRLIAYHAERLSRFSSATNGDENVRWAQLSSCVESLQASLVEADRIVFEGLRGFGDLF